MFIENDAVSCNGQPVGESAAEQVLGWRQTVRSAGSRHRAAPQNTFSLGGVGLSDELLTVPTGYKNRGFTQVLAVRRKRGSDGCSHDARKLCCSN